MGQAAMGQVRSQGDFASVQNPAAAKRGQPMILGEAKGFGRQSYDANESWTCLACDSCNTVVLKAGIKCSDCGQFEKTPKGPNRLYRNMSQAEIEAAGSRHMHLFNWEGVCECGRSLMQEI